ncbi:signal recognition particle protein [Candidatus Ishikawella capsulata]|uniref:Signal recognition particle protein n=1 Tax=Candidatus Ishikawaella capsulata Mpkobe TaxID=476281 RepID=C5WDI7_9ENTR|nr:signal recognition particle protein [Candidatus Ishikawaella capsulata]BAH83393.1 signal recognition particle component [Candidatus Ishikawaella capsulata Mpkobe]
MFDNLTNSLSLSLHKIQGSGRLTENNIEDTLRNVRMTLLEADVALPVVREFINKVKIVALGQDINKNLTPGQTFIKIIQRELIKAISADNINLNLAIQPPAVILLAGLQGVGKTTSVGKLGKLIQEKRKKKVLVVSLDVYRPAAIKQLELLAHQAGIDFYASNTEDKPINIANGALNYAKINFYDVLLIDTPGCSHINEILIEEIKQIHTEVNPIETLFVLDATIGQNAANIGKAFNNILPITGIILTKVDSDARGGAVLSVCYITGKPIKFIGVGEKIDALEVFSPERIASRILGMGDILSLIDDIESKVNLQKAENLAKKLQSNKYFSLNDFLEQLQYMRSIGGMANLLDKLPAIKKVSYNMQLPINDQAMIKMEAIIKSMTNQEREHPEIIKSSRKRRIATGAGLHVQDVNRLLKQFHDIEKMISTLKKSKMSKMIHNLKKMLFQKN